MPKAITRFNKGHRFNRANVIKLLEDEATRHDRGFNRQDGSVQVNGKHVDVVMAYGAWEALMDVLDEIDGVTA